MVNTRDLRYFLAVAEHQHVTRAAASLFLTQPALSKQIASLERHFDIKLFNRQSDGVTLTPAGKALMPYAQRMVELDEEAANEIRRVTRSSQKLTIGFWLSPANEITHGAITNFSARHPGLRLRLRRANWSEPGAGVVSGEADVAFVETPHDKPIQGLRTHRLAAEPLVLAVRRGHPLTSRSSVGLTDLVGETLFVLPQDAGQLAGIRWAAIPAGLSTESVTTIEETADGVATGLGVCILTRTVFRAHPHRGLAIVELRDAVLADYSLVWREQDEQRAELRDLVQALVAAHSKWTAMG